MRPIDVGQRKVGPGAPCFIAAEVGINHNGDMALARRMVDAAADCGVDAVKFQNYRTEEFLSDRSLTYTYSAAGKAVTESQWEMFKRCELSPDALAMLAAHCRQRGVVFFSTPCSQQGIEDCVRAGAPLLKNGSDFLTHLPLIRAMARTGLPTALSLGMADPAEVGDAVKAFREAGGTGLILLHCTSSYPTPAAEVNLRRIPALAAEHEALVGFSDHTEGLLAAVGALALGACFLEKHFTLDRGLPGPDHRFSSDPAELRALVSSVRAAEKMLGSATLGPAASEEASRRDFRLSCVAARELPAGHRLSEADIAFRRPGTGLPPKAAAQLVGKALVRPVAQGYPFTLQDIS